MCRFYCVFVAALISLSSCKNEDSDLNNHSDSDSSQTTSFITNNLIKLNQLGFLTNDSKSAIVTGLSNVEFKILSVADNREVFSAQLSPLANWKPAGDEVSIADFSSLKTIGEYRIEVEGLLPSNTFSISDNIFDDLHDATIKAYYFNRSSIELLEQHAGEFARPAGHLDTNVLVHASAVSVQRPEGTIISSPKGWYDAGDFGKYVVNSGISTYTLLIAYEHFPEYYEHLNLNIPESDNNIPDLIDEINWNLEWLLTMQDPEDGGVYHKLTTLRFADAILPHLATEQRYVIQKGTSATLNFSAVMAVASRIFKNFEVQFPGCSEQYQQAAISAWNWAQNNSDIPYRQPADVVTGAYGDRNFTDEFAWAAAELFLLTQDSEYLDRFKLENVGMNVPEWAQTHALGYLSLINNGRTLLTSTDYEDIYQQVISQADGLITQHRQSAYGVAMIDSDFVWGSNSVAMNKAMLLMQAWRHTSQIKYKEAAIGLLDYVLGKNPTDYSYVTGFGHKPPMDIHHRQSEGDTVVAPVPGFIAGGPQNGWQDGCDYPSRMPAKSYLDDHCSYSTNEVTINWNAPLVYVLAALINQ